MRTIRTLTTVAAIAVIGAAPLYAAVAVTRLDPQVSQTPEGERVAQGVVLTNEIAHYTLNYDVIHDPDTPDEVTSNWWAWQSDTITLGMTEPSGPNWYWQGIIVWKFDDESLHMRPAQVNVIRDGGQDGMVEYLWDTPKVRASLRFALATGSDKLLMFGSYEPKEPVQNVRMTLTCYPTGYAEPRRRAVTTALGTREQGETVSLDLARERWVLYEDLTEGRPGQGPSGLLIGTPDAFESITVPVGAYGITTTLRLPGGATDFALGLYDYPLFPDINESREYFARSADAEAEQIGRMAAGDLSQPLPPMPLDAERMARLRREGADMLDRPAELWRPNPEPLDFPWAARLPGGPIRTGILCQRWQAWETMELARRMEMDAQHIYFDTDSRLVDPGRWHYSSTTGIGALPQGVAARKAAEIATDETMELYLIGAIEAAAIPGVARTAIVDSVAAGAGLLLTGPAGRFTGWPEEIFASEDPGLAEIILRSFPDWDQIPGYREGDRGRIAGEPPIRAWRFGEGRVVHLNVGLNRYSTLVPRNDAVEGLHAATDRCLAIAARAALAAAGRTMVDDVEAAASLLVRMQDDLGRVLALREATPGAGPELPQMPAGRQCFVDTIARDADGAVTGIFSAASAAGPEAMVSDLAISPSTVTAEPAPPWVDIPEGGQVQCSATLADTPDGAQIQWTVRDIHDRVVAQATTPAQADASVTLDLPRPLTPAHILDVAVLDGDAELAYERLRFTMTVPYPFNDFTGLVWTYAGGDPILLNTDRICYEQGAGMSDLCHMGGYSSEGAAREYAVSAQSGLRFIPYVTRYAGGANADNERIPCMHDPDYIAAEQAKITRTCAQAAPYSPPAYTLGDENYLIRSEFEGCHTDHSVAAFREWLREQYADIAALNGEWATDYADFGEIHPITIAEAAEQSESFAPWIDHKLFMDTAFAEMHELGASFVKSQDPDTKVGWDGFLGYNWKMGYDFAKLTANLELNQTYNSQFLQGELYRSFKRDDAFTGKWGNRVADVEAGWHSFPWDCLLAGDNSVWWWTSWGVDYIPFNPDLSLSNFGRWFFESLEETRTGPGRLLLEAGRQHAPIAVLYSHRDLFAATLGGQLAEGQPWAGDARLLRTHEAILRALRDAGYQYTHLTFEDVVEGRLSPSEHRVFVLPLASCISDEMAGRLREYVEGGGTLIVDGRAGLLSGQGRVRDGRPLDDLLGVASPAGLDAFVSESATGEAAISGTIGEVTLDLASADLTVFEPGLTVTTGTALAEVGGAPIGVINEVGEGRAILLNFATEAYNGQRTSEEASAIQETLVAAVESAGVRPPAIVTRTDGSRPLCLQTVQFGSGPLRYLAVQQDILVRGIGEQELRIELDRPAAVYDIRAGERIGEGRVSAWETTIDRGFPRVYALLPYEVTGVDSDAPASAPRGATVEIAASVSAAAQPATHVVRMDVYAPGSDTAHREYSQNIVCPRGAGSASIPFALNDPAGSWRIELTDVASGMSTERILTLE
ncbi:MAG: beta-galactosidase [Armatimonadota bacterium]|jgi:hypothetical protein